jgi:hypothetical protein
MIEICERCKNYVWGVVDGLCPDCTDDLKPNKTHEEAKEQDYKDGHKKGVRDMWEAGKEKCEGEAYFDGNNSAECKDNCTFETCPIAQKLLKGVK